MNIAHHFNSMHKNWQFYNINDICFYLRSFDDMYKKEQNRKYLHIKRKKNLKIVTLQVL